MAIEWVVGIGVFCALAGFGLGWLVTAGASRKTAAQAEARAEEVEAQLAQSREELEDYRREVYGQFAQTADRFKQLDESYHALHQQLAASAVALCGEQAGPLLAAPERGAILTEDDLTEESVVHDVVVDEAAPGEEEAVATVAAAGEVDEDVQADASAESEEIPTITDALDDVPAEPLEEAEATVRVAEVDTPSATDGEVKDGEDEDALKRTA